MALGRRFGRIQILVALVWTGPLGGLGIAELAALKMGLVAWLRHDGRAFPPSLAGSIVPDAPHDVLQLAGDARAYFTRPAWMLRLWTPVRGNAHPCNCLNDHLVGSQRP